MSRQQRQWAVRVGWYAALVVGLYLALRVFDYGPRPLPLALLTAVAVAAVWVILDTITNFTSAWPVDAVSSWRERRPDRRLMQYQWVIANHVDAAEPDGALRDRLASLTDRRLLLHHDVRRPSAAADALMGPSLSEVLASPPRRLRAREIDQLLTRIEEL